MVFEQPTARGGGAKKQEARRANAFDLQIPLIERRYRIPALDRVPDYMYRGDMMERKKNESGYGMVWSMIGLGVNDKVVQEIVGDWK